MHITSVNYQADQLKMRPFIWELNIESYRRVFSLNK